jgi:hypothetical protein
VVVLNASTSRCGMGPALTDSFGHFAPPATLPAPRSRRCDSPRPAQSVAPPGQRSSVVAAAGIADDRECRPSAIVLPCQPWRFLAAHSPIKP